MDKRCKIELICPYCGKSYLKAKSEYNRNQKKGRKSYCSLSCTAKDNFNANLPPEKRSNYDISKHCKDQIDEYTEFRYVFKSLKARMHKGCNVSLHYLKILWEHQNGICPYTGIKLKLIKHGYKFQDISKNRYEIASLDRIDSSKGYEEGNLCFVSTMVNFMKNNLNVDLTLEFCYIMRDYLNTKTKQDIKEDIKNISDCRYNGGS